MRRYGPVYVEQSPIHREGVFAAVDVKKGERIFAIDDSNVMPAGRPLAEVEREHRQHCDYLPGRKVVIMGEPMAASTTVWHCNCGSVRCRREVHSDFFHLPLELQMEYLPLLDDWYIEENLERVEALRMSLTTDSGCG